MARTFEEIPTRPRANPNEAAPEAAMPQAAWEALTLDAVQAFRPPHTPVTLRRWLQTNLPQAWTIGAPQPPHPTPPPPDLKEKRQGQGKAKGRERTPLQGGAER